ncbi:TPA: hypothetical protein N0F65_001836 [Lagenidium giganteum]|uniref:Receptor protein-tyrosine kinase n=1 Tax=Lagenidium giganteum TaxID=4803 RepID=A0AAV2Z1W3_9STRA|nr:TPA: hypothetical protein N0F65_001836 [Lagenidium giganteum]
MSLTRHMQIRLWNRTLSAFEVKRASESNKADPSMLVLLRLNRQNPATMDPSGRDASGRGNDFRVENVLPIADRAVTTFGISSDGGCYCSQYATENLDALPANVCDSFCNEEHSQTCGAINNSDIISAFDRGVISVNGLSPETTYDFTLVYLSPENVEFEVSKPLVVTTPSATVPSEVSGVAVVSTTGGTIEIQWLAADDDGGSPVVAYEVFVNGFSALTTSNGDTLSSVVSGLSMLSSYALTVRALNAVGAGPQSSPIIASTSDMVFPIPPRNVTVVAVSGGTVSLSFTQTSDGSGPPELVTVELRESTARQFGPSTFRQVGPTQVTIYKLRHDTTYVFQLFTVDSRGVRSMASTPAIASTGARTVPDKTPVPVIVGVTGGSIKLSLNEPLDTGGAPITGYNIKMEVEIDGAHHYQLLQVVDRTSDQQEITIYRTPDGVHLAAATNYTLNALALQAGSTCNLYDTEVLQSDPVTATTAPMTIPGPPRVAVVGVDGCTATFAIVQPENFQGSMVNEFRAYINLNDVQVLEQRVDLNSTMFTVHDLLAFTPYTVSGATVVDQGMSSLSAASPFTTDVATHPSSLTALQISQVTSSKVILQWEPPLHTGGGALVGYQVFRSEPGGTAPSILAYDGDDTVLQATIAGLLANSNYTFAVVSFNQYDLASDVLTGTIHATTASASEPSAPSHLVASNVTGGAFSLGFARSDDNGGFLIQDVHYEARARFLKPCYSSTDSCQSCSHYNSALGNLPPVYATLSTTCASRPCDSNPFQLCCFNDNQACGILMTANYSCDTDRLQCAFYGLTYLTDYMAAVAAVNPVGRAISLIRATGGMIQVSWTLANDTGGGDIARVSLTSNGVPLIDTTTEGSFTHCGNLRAGVTYTYMVEVENDAGRNEDVTVTFETTAESVPAAPGVRMVTVGATWAEFNIDPPCDNGGDANLTFVYSVNFSSGSTSAYFPCCALHVDNLTPLTTYNVQVQARNTAGAGLWTSVTVTTAGGIPSVVSTSLRYALAAELGVQIIPPVSSGGDIFHVELEAYSASSVLVNQQTINCVLQGATISCPDVVRIPGLNSFDDATFTVRVRAVGVIGASDWNEASYAIDSGQPGSISIRATTQQIQEGEVTTLLVERLYGTTYPESVSLLVSSQGFSPFVACDLNKVGVFCYAAPASNNAMVSFSAGEYQKTITFLAPDDDVFQSAPLITTFALGPGGLSAVSTATVAINVTDNGDAGFIYFLNGGSTRVSEASVVNVGLYRSKGTRGTVSVRVLSSLSSALTRNRVDQVVTFGDGVSTIYFQVSLRDNDAFDAERSVVLRLSDATGGAAVSTEVFTIVVVDDGDVSLPGYPDLFVQGVSGGMISYVWDLPTFVGGDWASILGYRLKLTSQDGTITRMFSATTARKYSVYDLPHNTTFIATIASVNQDGVGSFSAPTVTSTTGPTAPGPVLDLTIIDITGGYARLAWLEPLDKGGVPLLGYYVTVANLKTDFQQTLKLSRSATNISIPGLMADSPYRFDVWGTNAMNLDAPVDSAIGTTVGASVPAKPPAPVFLNATGGSIVLSILSPFDCGGSTLTKFTLLYARLISWSVPLTEYGTFPITINAANTTVANVTVYGLLSSSTYQFRVAISNEMGQSPLSSTVSFTTGAPSNVGGVPMPTVIDEIPGEITLGWDAPLDTGGVGITGYVIHARRGFANGSWTDSVIVYDGRNSLNQSALIPNLSGRTRYAFSVTAYNLRSLCFPDDADSTREELVLVTMPSSVPTTPKRLHTTHITGGSISIAWDPPVSAGGEPLQGYVVSLATEGGNFSIVETVAVSDPRAITVYKLWFQTNYQFVVSAINSLGVGKPSTQLQVTTSFPTPPTEPRFLTKLQTNSVGAILLQWTGPVDEGGTSLIGYKIYRDGDYLDDILLTDPVVTYRDESDIHADQEYEYAVAAVNSVLSGNQSSLLVVSGHPTVAALGSIHASNIRGGSVDVQVTPSGDSGGVPITSYKISIARGTVIVGTYNGSEPGTTFTGLFALTQYSLSFQTINQVGPNQATSTLFFTTAPEPPQKPPVPRLVVVYGGRVSLQVTAPADFGGAPVSSYNFYVGKTLMISIPTVALKSYDVVGLMALTRYSIAVTANNTAGEGSKSDALDIITTPVVVPGAPASLVLVGKTTDVLTIGWDLPLDTGGDTYLSAQVEVSKAGVIAFTAVDAISPLTTSNIDPGSQFNIRVRVKNSAGFGPWSASITGATDPIAPGVMAFQFSTVDVSEAGAFVNVTVLRTSGGRVQAKCNYATADGTAIDGTHYVKKTGTLTFATGVMSQSFTVAIINNDVIDDPDKYFFVRLSVFDSASGVIGSVNSTKVTILDDGDAGVLQFGKSNYSVLENAGTLAIPIVRAKAFSGTITALITGVDVPGGAIQGVQYSIIRPLVIIGDQQKVGTIVIQIVNDKIYQIKKILGLNISIQSGRAGIGAPVPTYVEILDDGDYSAPGLPTAITLRSTTGGSISASWTAPENRGAANVTYLTYNVVITTDADQPRQLTAFNTSLKIYSVMAVTVYNVSVAAANALYQGSLSAPVTIETYDVTNPTAPLTVQMVWRTGGAFNVSWTRPLDTGGADIFLYRVVTTAAAQPKVVVDSQDVRTGTSTAVYGLRPITNYLVTVQAINTEGLFGAIAAPLAITTRAATIPGKPLGVTLIKATGGSLYVSMSLPLDMGGLNVSKFILSSTSAQLPNVFTDVYVGLNRTTVLYRLLYGTSYKLRYRVATTAGTSESSDIAIMKTTFLTVPTEPRNLTFVSRTGGAVTLSWNPPLDWGGSPLRSYQINFYTGYTVSSQFQQSFTDFSQQAAKLTVPVTKLTSNTTYGFYVVAMNDISACADATLYLNYSTVRATTLSISPPDTPLKLQVALTTAGLQVISWSPPGDLGGVASVSYLLFSETNSLLYNGSVSGYRRGSLKAGTTYSYSVAAYNGAGTSALSAVISTRTLPNVTVPAAPTDLTQQRATGGSVTLVWNAPLDGGGSNFTGYQVFRNNVPLFALAALVSTTQYTDEDRLLADQEYIYMVQAANILGTGERSISLIARTGLPSLAKPPSAVTTSALGAQLVVTWVLPINTGGVPITGFSIELFTASGTLQTRASLSSTTTAFTYFGIRGNVSYTMKAYTRNSAGPSVPAVVSFTNTPAIRPAPPPTPIVISIGPESVVLQVDIPQDDGGAPIQKIRVYQDGVLVLQVPTTDVVQVNMKSLRAKTTYTFTTTAVSLDYLGESARSGAVTATTANPIPPSGLYSFAVVKKLTYSLVFSWLGPDDNGGDDIIFELEITKDGTNMPNVLTTKNNTYFEVTSLEPQTNYVVRVRVKNSAGVSPWAGPLTVQTDIARKGYIVIDPVNVTVFENVTQVTVVLQRLNGTATNVDCNVAVDPSTNATAGVDFQLGTLASRTFRFAEGETNKSFTVKIVNDDVYQPAVRMLALVITDTTARLDLQPLRRGYIFILDDGDAGLIDFVAANTSVIESQPYLVIPLRRTVGTSSPVTVRVSSTGQGTAILDQAFRLPNPPEIVFGDRVASQTITVIIKNNDQYDYPFKFFVLSLSVANGGGGIGATKTINVTILDDGDQSPPGPVSNFAVTRTTGGAAMLAWSTPINVGGQALWIDSYVVSYGRGDSATTTSITTENNNTFFEVGSLQVVTSYSFQVLAVNVKGRGELSGKVSASTTDYTTPGPLRKVALVRATGGLLYLNLQPPNDMGGAPILGYAVYLQDSAGIFQPVYNATDTNTTLINVSVTYPQTTYKTQFQALNFMGYGNVSEALAFTSGPLSMPGPPYLRSTDVNKTGGSFAVTWDLPIDTGGHFNLSYVFYIRIKDQPDRFSRATTQGLSNFSAQILTLYASTTYELCAVTIADDNTNSIASGTVNTDEGLISTSFDPTLVYPGEYVELGVSVSILCNFKRLCGHSDEVLQGYLFQLDPNAPILADTLEYRKGWSSTDTNALRTNVTPDFPYDIYARGNVSNIITSTTQLPTGPGNPPPLPTLIEATGGYLQIKLFAPPDTALHHVEGGIPIISYNTYVNGMQVRNSASLNGGEATSADNSLCSLEVDANLIGFENRNENPNNLLQIDAYAQIGGLAPNTNYSFVYMAINAFSSCAAQQPALNLPVVFRTKNPSRPKEIRNLRQTGATGGGIRVEWTVPIDAGSDRPLYYQVYMSPINNKKNWSLVYNDTQTLFWKTQLQSKTFYWFKASCRNEFGVSINVTEVQFNTSGDSPPGPVGALTMIKATGGMIHFNWSAPEDNGGSEVTGYSVEGDSRMYSVDKDVTEFYFGHLVANTVYEFTVYAKNRLGTGSDGKTASLRTGDISPPSTPPNISVVESSGGAVVVSVAIPDDTGGVALDKLDFEAFANGVLVSRDSVKQLTDYTPPQRAGSRRLAAASDDSLYVQIGSLMPLTAYSFSLRIVNNKGSSDSTTPAMTNTKNSTVPAVPDPPVVAAATGGSLTLTWTDPVDTGGLPLTSYRLLVCMGTTYVTSCEGLVHTCFAGNLQSLTTYNVTLQAFNALGGSVVSAPVFYDTKIVSQPQAPLNFHVVNSSNDSAAVAWDPSTDFGGAFIDSYLIEYWKDKDPVHVFNGSTAPNVYSFIITGLTPLTAYTASVRAITSDGIEGNESALAYFTTSLLPEQPAAPVIGCASAKVVTLSWMPIPNAKRYQVHRNDGLVMYATEAYLEDSNVVVGTKYSYQVVVERVGGGVSTASEPTSYTVVNYGDNSFQCSAMKGSIQMKNYTNNFRRQWTIVPPTSFGVSLEISDFFLECDHDQLEIVSRTGSNKSLLWRGGCRRSGNFVIDTNSSIDNVTITFTSDGNVTQSGFAISYQLDPTVTTALTIPCPGVKACSAKGSCRDGVCTCFSGYVGEDCSNHYICPSDLKSCGAACDPVCFMPQDKVIIVSALGDDVQGNGLMMNTSAKGTASKAVATIRRAVQLAQPDSVILLHPYDYNGNGFCGLNLTTRNISIRGLMGMDFTKIDCLGNSRAFTVQGVPAHLSDLTLVNTAAPSGGAILVNNGTLTLNKLTVSRSTAGTQGGCILATNSTITLTETTLTKCFAVDGGGVFLDNSTMNLQGSSLLDNHATNGGAFATQTWAVVNAIISWIKTNNASALGGAAFLSGSVRLQGVDMSYNNANTGAGVAIQAGMVDIRQSKLYHNVAYDSGGGIALLELGSLKCTSTMITQNRANVAGGGLFVLSNESVSFDSTSAIVGGSAATGGGVYGRWSRATLAGINVKDCSSIYTGGCVALQSCTTVWTQATISKCDAPRGGAFYLSNNSSIEVSDSIITRGNATNAGGGLFIDSSALLGLNTTISYSKAVYRGGGIFSTGISTVARTDVWYCNASIGGGVYGGDSKSLTLDRVHISNSIATLLGGGLATNSSRVAVSASLVEMNDAPSGGGLYALSSVISGSLEIKNNTADFGAGAFMNGINTLEQLSVTSNNATTAGGGLQVDHGVVTVRDTNFTLNICPEGAGGGIYLDTSSMLHRGVVVTDSLANWGGGLCINASSFQGEDSTSLSTFIEGNNASYGGNIYMTGDAATLSETVTGVASAERSGGGLAVVNAAGCVIQNGITRDAYAAERGGGIYFGEGAVCSLSDYVIESNEGSVSGGGIAIEDAQVQHANVTVTHNNGDYGGGVSLIVSDNHIGHLVASPAGKTRHPRSVISANTVSVDSFGANVQVECNGTCSITGVDVTDGIVISSKDTKGRGGGMYVDGSGELVFDNLFLRDNAAFIGGGIFLTGKLTVEFGHSALIANSAHEGGGLMIEGDGDTSVTLNELVIYNNTAEASGGGCAIAAALVNASTILVIENKATSEKGLGGGLYNTARQEKSAFVALTHCLVMNNKAFEGGGLATDQSQVFTQDSMFTGDLAMFASDSWSDRFQKYARFAYEPAKALMTGIKVDAHRGDHIYLTGTAGYMNMTSSLVSYGVGENGGGAFVEGFAVLDAQNCEFSNNNVTETGGSIQVNDALVNLVDSAVINSVSSNLGGGIYVQNSGKVNLNRSLLSFNYADDSGGGVYLDTGDQVRGTFVDSHIVFNLVKGQGSGVFVGRDATHVATGCTYASNGGLTQSGRNEGGGGIAAVDAFVDVANCTFANNTAINGGAVLLDRAGSVIVNSTYFVINSADQFGGAIAATVTSELHVGIGNYFESNFANSGGAVAASDSCIVDIELSEFKSNIANDFGGAFFVQENANVTARSLVFTDNVASFGGAINVASTLSTTISNSTLQRNKAQTRGGALYYSSIKSVTTDSLKCHGNYAPSGGCLFWVTYDQVTPIVPCTNCSISDNAVYDIATNTRDVKILWWPTSVISDISIMEPPDEESISGLNDTNQSLASMEYIWPRVKAIDLYGQTENLDTATECQVDASFNDSLDMKFTPASYIKAIAGVVSYVEATFLANPRDYVMNISCNLPEKKPIWFVQPTQMLPCPPGFSTDANVRFIKCSRCLKNRYSMDGERCYDCPTGAACSTFIRRATETTASEWGTTSPRTTVGFYLFNAPSTQHARACNHSEWKDTDPCNEYVKPNLTITEIIHACATAPGFKDSWSPDRIFSCLAQKSFYTCDVLGACNPDISVEIFNEQHTNSSCTIGYDQAICSVCADHYKRAKDKSCLPCEQANAEIRKGLQWQNFVFPVLICMALVAAIVAVRYYLRDETEIQLLAKAEADRRLKPPVVNKRRSIVDVARDQYRRQSEMVQGRLDGIKDRVRALLKRKPKKNAKILFGIEVEPPTRQFPIKPSKLKIFIGFFQIFGNFRESFVMKWPAGIQNLMSFAAQFNLDIVALAGIDCVITTNYYFTFTVTVVLVILTLTVITAYFFAGMRSYSTKLLLIPRNCLRCGLPVLECDKVQNEEASLNPLVLMKLWWRTRHDVSNAQKAAEAAEQSATQVGHMEERKLKREFGMSQVRTPHLGVFHSVHKVCPSSNVLSGTILERTVRSNLRVWQARVKLRMNYLTYRNKCLKLYCWIALFLYPTVSKTILMIFNCQEVGNTWYMVVDRRIICYNKSWAVFGAMAAVGSAVWVAGIPFFFWVLIRLAQDRGIAARIKLLGMKQCKYLRKKWLKEVLAQHAADGIVVPEMDNIEVQNEQLKRYMKKKNLRDSTVEARLGFIYADYCQDYWWFEVVDLSRKLFLSSVIIFVQNGSPEQVLLAVTVCLITMWFLLYFQPYGDHSDNLIASVTQLQLFLTLWLGLMFQLDNQNEESMVNQKLFGVLIIGTCLAVTFFGIGMLIKDGMEESNRLFKEDREDRKKRIKAEVKKRWRLAYNYACYENQIQQFGQLSFRSFSVPAMMESFRRVKAANPHMDPARISLAALEVRLPELTHEPVNK